MTDLPELPARAFAKADPAPDELFYETPRLVTHIDAGAIAAVTRLYRELLPPGGTVLDLMGSWVSHLPDDVAYAEVIGHGMNTRELEANPRYTRWFVQDLNKDQHLPLPCPTRAWTRRRSASPYSICSIPWRCCARCAGSYGPAGSW